jgi:hypothetical protein
MRTQAGTAGKVVFNAVRVVNTHGVPLGAHEEGEIVAAVRASSMATSTMRN